MTQMRHDEAEATKNVELTMKLSNPPLDVQNLLCLLLHILGSADSARPRTTPNPGYRTYHDGMNLIGPQHLVSRLLAVDRNLVPASFLPAMTTIDPNKLTADNINSKCGGLSSFVKYVLAMRQYLVAVAADTVSVQPPQPPVQIPFDEVLFSGLCVCVCVCVCVCMRG
jgi:hypothetical protein